VTAAAPIRILHCHSTFSLGGKEARAVRLMNAFGDSAQHVVLSAMPEELGAAAGMAPGIMVDFPGDAGAPTLHGKPSPWRYLKLARYFQGFDLILTYNWGSMDAVMAHRLLSPVMRLPRLIHHEDGFNADEAERLSGKRNAFRKAALPTADALVVPSHRLEAVARAHWGGDALTLLRISNGIALDAYRQTPAPDALPGLTRQPGEVIVGTIAGLRTVKDLPLLVEALALTPPHMRLVVVGEGPDRARIEGTAARMGVAERVLLTGFQREPARFVGLFDMLALSSLSEQQPIAVMEGMAAGLPILSPAVGDVAEMVAAENAPFIVERRASALAEAMTTLAGDGALRGRIGAANQAAAAVQFDERQMIARYAALYGRAAGLPEAIKAN